MKNFLICVDCQYDFMLPDGILYVSGAEETIVPIIQYLAALDVKTTAGVLFTYDTHVQQYTEFNVGESEYELQAYDTMAEAAMFPIHCELFTKGHRNVINSDIVDPNIPAYQLVKGVFDMWEEKTIWVEDILYDRDEGFDRDVFFNDLKTEGVELIDIVGVALNFCVKQAVDGLLARGFTVRLHTTMTRGIQTGQPGDCDARVLFADQIAAGQVIVED